MQYAVSGGAPLGTRLGHFFRGLGVTILEGYGLTETTAPATVNRPANIKIGTVGPPLPGVTVRIADDGEILVKGVNVFARLLQQRRGDRRTPRRRWFQHRRPRRDRRRRLPADHRPQEGDHRHRRRQERRAGRARGPDLARTPIVGQCIVVGDQKPFIAALVTLDEEMLPAWLGTTARRPMSVAAGRTRPGRASPRSSAPSTTPTRPCRNAESIRKFEILDDRLHRGERAPHAEAEHQAQRHRQGLRRRDRGHVRGQRRPRESRSCSSPVRWSGRPRGGPLRRYGRRRPPYADHRSRINCMASRLTSGSRPSM